MKYGLPILLLLLLALSLIGCSQARTGAQAKEEGEGRTEGVEGPADEERKGEEEEAEREAVRRLVEDFGAQLQQVSLLAPEPVVRESLREHYGPYVTPELLSVWEQDPGLAPGRLVSSPWPDRIEIRAIEQTEADTYLVRGEVIAITSVEKANGGVAATRPIALTVTRYEGDWRISAVELGEEEASLLYENTEFGFRFQLPSSWKGYSIVAGEWEGRAIDGPREGEVVERGPSLAIRHPLWTEENPRQDIPIYVFTHAQWEALAQQRISVSAAPVGPTELGRNERYVFALPPRYNFAFLTGYEEVEAILARNPLHPVSPLPAS